MRSKAHRLFGIILLITLLTVIFFVGDSPLVPVLRYSVWDFETANPLDPMQVWMATHQHTNDRIDRIYFAYYQTPIQHISFASHYDPNTDPNLPKVLAAIRFSDFPIMRNRILDEAYAPVAGIMMITINCMTKTDNGPVAYDSGSKKSWVAQFDNKLKMAQAPSNLNEADFAAIGMLAIPYLASEAENHNKEAAIKLFALVGSEKPMNGDDALKSWDIWKVEYSELIRDISSFINSSDDYLTNLSIGFKSTK